MNKTFALLVATVLFASVSPPARAGEAARLCKFDQFARVAKITPEQRKVMARILEGLDAKLETWDIVNRPKRRDLESQLEAARKTREMAKIAKVLTARRALEAERTKLVGPYAKQLVAQLSADQRGRWEGHVLFTEMHGRFKRFQLDSGQVADIRSRCNEAGRTIAELWMSGKGVEPAKVKSRLEREIARDVLTGSQREAYTGTIGRKQYTTGEGGTETEAERAARIRIAVDGFVGRRLAEDAAKSKKEVEDAIKTANDQLLPGRRSRPDTKNNRNKNNRKKNNRNKNNRNRNNRNRNNRNRRK